MKFSIVPILAILSAGGGVDAQCDFCPGGISKDLKDVVPSGAGGENCESIATEALTLDDEYFCGVYKDAEAVCCPPSGEEDDEEEPDKEEEEEEQKDGEEEEEKDEGEKCSVCSGGLTVEGDTVIPYPEAQGMKCEQLLGIASNIDKDSKDCDEMTNAEDVCCPPDGGEPAEAATTAAPNTEPENSEACVVCPDGLTVSKDTNIGGGNTCGDLLDDALGEEEGSNICDAMKEDEETCCPPPAEAACNFCPDGLTVEEDENVGQGRTCGDLMVVKLTIEEDSGECRRMKEDEEDCCPVVEEIEEACSVCAEGVTEEYEDVEIGGEKTCKDLMEDKLAVEDDSQVCEAMKRNEEDCCPAAVEIDEPCSVCANGVAADLMDVDIGNDKTCANLLEDSLTIEDDSQVCDAMKRNEEDCCPPAAEEVAVPCSVCADGLTVTDATEIGSGGEFTCGRLMTDKLTVEDGSEECDQMKGAEVVCCLSVADDPCQVCVDGLTEGYETVDIGNDKTCENLMLDKLNVEEDSRTCDMMKDLEEDCCPEGGGAEEIEVPCAVCVDGITAEDDVETESGSTCAELVAEALLVETDSDECSAFQGAETTCCPRATADLATDPCPVCATGLTVDATTTIGTSGEFTCASLITDALTVEADDKECTNMLKVEDTCCPEMEAKDTPEPTPAPQVTAEVATTPEPTPAPQAVEEAEIPDVTPAPQVQVVDATVPGPTPAPQLVSAVAATPAPQVASAIAATPAPQVASAIEATPAPVLYSFTWTTPAPTPTVADDGTTPNPSLRLSASPTVMYNQEELPANKEPVAPPPSMPSGGSRGSGTVVVAGLVGLALACLMA